MMMRVPVVEDEANIHNCGCADERGDKYHHHGTRPWHGKTTGAALAPPLSRQFWAAALLVVSCIALTAQIQFFRTAHQAASASPLRDLRRDVMIHFEQPVSTATPPKLDDAAPPPTTAEDSSDADGAAAAAEADNSVPSNHREGEEEEDPVVVHAPQEGEVTLRLSSSETELSLSSALTQHARQLLLSYDAADQVKPLWNCSAKMLSGKGKESGPDVTRNITTTSHDGSSNPRNNKFVFVHVYKTAGSSVRDFIRWYGRACQRSVSIVFGCANVAVSTLDRSVWKPCRLSYGITSDGKHEYQGGAFGRDLFDVSDLVGGHLPLGVHLSSTGEKNHDDGGRVQHLTFVRDPLDKYVSGKLYSNRKRNWTVDDAVKRLSYEFDHLARKSGHYEKYSSYLLTPAQKAAKLTQEEKVEAMQSNLATMNVLVGVVERMDESFQMLQHVLDGSNELDGAFRFLRQSKLVRNKSALSTSDLVRRLRQNDPDFDRKARLVLRYEYSVYDFAVKLHEMQYDKLVRRKATR